MNPCDRVLHKYFPVCTLFFLMLSFDQVSCASESKPGVHQYQNRSKRSADCWWTGCQPDSWAVVGCEHYGRYEADRKSCDGGNKYQCCPSKVIVIADTDSKAQSEGECGDARFFGCGCDSIGNCWEEGWRERFICKSHWTTVGGGFRRPGCGRDCAWETSNVMNGWFRSLPCKIK